MARQAQRHKNTKFQIVFLSDFGVFVVKFGIKSILLGISEFYKKTLHATISVVRPDVPSIDYLTRGYNALTAAPLNLGSTGLRPIFDLSKTESAIGTKFMKPKGTDVHMIPGGMANAHTKIIKSAYDFQEASTEHVGFDIGIPEIFSFSESASFSQFRQVL